MKKLEEAISAISGATPIKSVAEDKTMRIYYSNGVCIEILPRSNSNLFTINVLYPKPTE